MSRYGSYAEVFARVVDWTPWSRGDLFLATSFYQFSVSKLRSGSYNRHQVSPG